jgi:sRNA-binding carbon storage regulator CsrA
MTASSLSVERGQVKRLVEAPEARRIHLGKLVAQAKAEREKSAQVEHRS